MTDDRAVSTVQTVLAETRWLPVPCPTEYLPALARDVLWALEQAGMPVVEGLTDEWSCVTQSDAEDGTLLPDEITDDRASAEELAAEQCQSCDACRNAQPDRLIRRSVGPWVLVVATPQEQPTDADGNPICTECSMPEPSEWCWQQSVSCPFGKPPRSQT